MNKKKMPKRRSWIATSAFRTGAGTHSDKRKRREGTRRQRTQRIIDSY